MKLLEYLDKEDKTMYWLAENSRLSYPTIFRLSKNKSRSVRFNTLNKIMEALDIEDFNKIIEYE